MTWWAIGHAGAPARLLVDGIRAVVDSQIGNDEVCVPVPHLGEWIIAPDGESATAIEPTIERQWMDVRRRRDELLDDCDWTQMPDVAEETRLAWRPYRQALRDLTEAASPADVIWPVPPTDGEPA